MVSHRGAAAGAAAVAPEAAARGAAFVPGRVARAAAHSHAPLLHAAEAHHQPGEGRGTPGDGRVVHAEVSREGSSREEWKCCTAGVGLDGIDNTSEL
jgi:hypothetical protein